MLQAHQRKLEEEAGKNPSGPKERVAFDRERDMQGSIIDEAKRKALLKKQMGLGNRFATGASKFLWLFSTTAISPYFLSVQI